VDDNIWLDGLFGCLMLTVFCTIILSLCSSVLVCLFCPQCVSVVTFDSEDKDKREVCGGSSCSSKDDVLMRLVCAFSVIVCYLIALSGCLLFLQLVTVVCCLVL